MGDDTYGYAYDPIGNRIVTTYLPSVVHPTHDADGNMAFLPSTSGGGAGGEGWYFQWNGENRLILASNAQHIVTYAYDHRGRMARKDVSVWDEQLAAYSPQLTAEFLWDGWNLVGETVAVGSGSTQSVATNYYTWGLDLSGRLQGAGGVGGLLAVTKGGAGVPPATCYPMYDVNGNISEYLSATDGAITAHLEYDVFGRAIVATGTAPAPFGFSTKYFDLETGMYYYGYRFYSPGMGRWMSRDPIEEIGGQNLYGFIDNSPVDYFDESGEMKWMGPGEAQTSNKILVDVGRNSQDVFLRVVKVTADYEAKKQVAENALRRALGNINCRFFQGSFTTGYWQVPKGLVQKYSDLLKNNNSSSIVIPVAEYSSAALTLANGFALLNQEPSLFDDLADALATYKGDRAIDSCYTVCEAITRYFSQFEAGNPLLAALNFANLTDCVSACTTECCQ